MMFMFNKFIFTNNLVTDPLEQFSVFSIWPFFNNLLVVFFSLFLLYYFVEKSASNLKHTFSYLAIRFKVKALLFILKMNSLPVNKFIYLPVLLVLYTFILFLNVAGMFPFFYTLTGLFIVTFTLSFSVWFGTLLLCLLEQKSKFWLIFLPPNCPKYLYFFLILIEIISYFARLISLSVRLFANMTAGHLLLKILAGLCFKLSIISPYFICIIPGFIVFFIIFLEFGVALIQAGIFIGLSAIYINNAVVLH